MIRAVLDTNILVSALISKKSSAPLKLYKAFIRQKFLLITSSSILAEVEDVINRENIIKYPKLSSQQRKEVLEQLVKLSYITLGADVTEETIIEKDPKDDKFIYAAIEGDADYVVSGDHHLLDLKECKGIKIITPNKFLAILESKNE